MLKKTKFIVVSFEFEIQLSNAAEHPEIFYMFIALPLCAMK